MDTPGAALEESELLTTAAMARLELSDDERASLRLAIGQMLTYFDQMRAADVSGLAPTTQATVASNDGQSHPATARSRLRPDAASPSSRRWPQAEEQALVARASDSEDGFVTTPNVL